MSEGIVLELPDVGDALRMAFHGDVLDGLSRRQKTVPSRWLYDDRGAALFEEITGLAEYYPTRVETGILRRYAEDIATFLGPEATLIEYGAGAGLKTEIVLSALQSPKAYVAIDISGDFLATTVARLEAAFPQTACLPVVADFTEDLVLPAGVPTRRRAAFFPGSTFGNLDDADGRDFLGRVHRHVGPKGKALIGIDLRKDVDTLIAAYADRDGVTADFNLNLLSRINRELAGGFDLGRFRHAARWNEAEGAVEMHLVSTQDQLVEVSGLSFRFEAGETIHTESSRKYDLSDFRLLVEATGWQVHRIWTDAKRFFAVVGLVVA